HKFCFKCLDSWRSKYDATSDKACPLCRKKIPPTRQMIVSYRMHKKMLSNASMRLAHRPFELPPIPGELGYEPHYFSEIPLEVKIELREVLPVHQQDVLLFFYQKSYDETKAALEKMEEQFGDFDLDDALEDPDEVKVEDLPWDITKAAATNEVGIVLDWLGPPPIAPERINAKNPEKIDRTILAEAVYEDHVGLMNIVLQFGANVDPLNALGTTPLKQATLMGLDKSTRILLEWGANKELGTDISAAQYAKEAGNLTLSKLLESPLGGRRCEIFGLQGRKDLNGRACVTTKYVPKNDRYEVKVEHTDEEVAIRSKNLKRRDRTPTDCGYYTTFEGVNKHGSNMWNVNRFVTSVEAEAMDNEDGKSR
ncbi:MAG: hypothetical protein SGILL_009261, partial [Bacillariaceae sp.]